MGELLLQFLELCLETVHRDLILVDGEGLRFAHNRGELQVGIDDVRVRGRECRFGRVDDAIAAGEEELEVRPAAESDDRRSIDVAGAVLGVIAIEEELALLVDGVDDAVAAGEEEFEIRPSRRVR